MLIHRNLGADNEHAKYMITHTLKKICLIQYLDAFAKEMLGNLMVLKCTIPVCYSIAPTEL